jgi:ornithine carbamoyltransferase
MPIKMAERFQEQRVLTMWDGNNNVSAAAEAANKEMGFNVNFLYNSSR